VFKSAAATDHSFSWDFVIGEVSGPILGNDFLRQFNLAVDPAACCVRSTATGAVFPGTASFSLGSAAAVLPAGVGELIGEFPEIVAGNKPLPAAKHGVEHFLQTSGPPVTSRFRRLDAGKLAAAKRIFAEWEKAGIVRRSSSSWSSPLHLVKKKDGSWRPCGDFRRLNLVTVEDKYPVPNMGDFTGQVEGCSVFSKLDLKNGYLQVPLHPSAIPKTAVITPFGLFEFLKMPFGLKNAGMSFQRLMDQVMAGLPFVFVYIDDILVASPDLATHLEHLRVVFQRLRQAGLQLNIEKCEFARGAVEFLGHRLSAAGCRPLEDKVAAISRRPPPTTVRELQQFLGVINFYRRFIPSAARLLAPLTDALKGAPPATAELYWRMERQAAFSAAKAALAAASSLAHPSASAELALVCDASSSHVGAALQQRRRGQDHWEPLGFFSRKLDSPQLNYSAFDRELFAAYAAVRHFRYQLEGRSFCIMTDHKPLLGAFSKLSDAWSPRQQRQLSFIAEYTADLRHVAGIDNVVADALSRPPKQVFPPSPAKPPGVKEPSGSLAATGEAVKTAGERLGPSAAERSSTPASQPPGTPSCAAVASPSPVIVDLAAIADAQPGCADTVELAASPSLQVKKVEIGGYQLWCDTTDGRLRPLVPASYRRSVFAAVHSLAHPGIRATKRLISSRWLWRGMATDIAAWCRDCQNCQRGKVTRQWRSPPAAIAVPQRRFSHIHVDLVGPLPSSGGFTHLLTVIDRTSRWLEAIPLASTTATAVADALVAGWIARFGVPSDLTSDRGVQFSSEIWGVLMSKLQIRHHLTTAYHPQANGLVERAHRQLKDALRSRLAGQDWLNHLPWVLLSLRSTPKEDSGVSSAELLYGTPLLLPGQPLTAGEAAPPPSGWQPEPIPTRPLSYAETAAKLPAALEAATFVYVRRGGVSTPLSPAYSGPFRVLSRSAKFFVLQVGDKAEGVSVDRLKPHTGSSAVQPALPPRRGRPPASAPSSTGSAPGAG